MLEAHSLKGIKKRIFQELPRQVIITKREPEVVFGIMNAFDMNRPIRYQTVRIEENRNSKLVGILFAHPATAIAQSEIVRHLPHFHLRSGDAVDFFCVGYGAYWPPQHYVDQEALVKIDGVDWLFSDQAFSEVIDELESETRWKYSGETELLLVSAVKDDSGTISLEYENAIVCNLEAMAKDNAFSSVRVFFTDLIRYAKSHSSTNSAWGLSDDRGIAIGKSALKEAVLSLLPKNLKESYKKAEHYAVRNIA